MALHSWDSGGPRARARDLPTRPSRRRVRRGSSCEAAPAEPAEGETRNLLYGRSACLGSVTFVTLSNWPRGQSTDHDAGRVRISASSQRDVPRHEICDQVPAMRPAMPNWTRFQLRRDRHASPAAGSAGAASQLDPRLTRLRLGSWQARREGQHAVQHVRVSASATFVNEADTAELALKPVGAHGRGA
jgi:hypothetical protein